MLVLFQVLFVLTGIVRAEVWEDVVVTEEIPLFETPVHTNESSMSLDDKVSELDYEIRGLNDRFLSVDPIDRPMAVMAISPAQTVKLPAVTMSDTLTGYLKGDTITFTISGTPFQISEFASKLSNIRSGIDIEYIEATFQGLSDVEAVFRVFGPKSVAVVMPDGEASEQRRRNFVEDAEKAVAQAAKLGDSQQKFTFFAEIQLRWPIGFPDIEKISYHPGVFTVYTSGSLDHMDPIVKDMIEQLNKLAAPAKVNLTPLVGSIIDGREVDVGVTEGVLHMSWKGLDVLRVKAKSIVSYLTRKNRVYMVIELEPPPTDSSEEGNRRPKIESVHSLRAYNLRDGALAWENVYYNAGSITNIVMDNENRIVFGYGFMLYAVDPESGAVIERWPLSGQADEVNIGMENDYIVMVKSFGGSLFAERLHEGRRSAPPYLRAAEKAADQLYGESLNNFIGPEIRTSDPDIDILELVEENLDIVSNLPRLLATKDRANPWYLYFEGLVEKATRKRYTDSREDLGFEDEKITLPDGSEKFEAITELPLENPYDFLQLGRSFEDIGLYKWADKSYASAFKRFIDWYRPTDVYSKFTGYIFFIEPVKNYMREKQYNRIGQLIDMAMRFQPAGGGMDAVVLETAAWRKSRGEADLAGKAMERYKITADRGFGLTVRWVVEHRLLTAAMWTLLLLMALVATLIAVRYRDARAAALASRGKKGLRERVAFAFESPANWFRFHTLTFASQSEKAALIVLWLLISACAAMLVIDESLINRYADDTFISDFDSPDFTNDLIKRMGVDERPDSLYVLGVASQQAGDTQKASNYYFHENISHARKSLRAAASNNLGVIAAGEGNVESAAEFFHKAVGWDPWLAEAVYNKGVLENNPSLKKRAVELGLDPAYSAYYPDKVVRAGINRNILAKAFSGHGYNRVSDLLSHWAEALTGMMAADSGSMFYLPAHFASMILGAFLLVYYFVPRRETEDFPRQTQRWEYFAPGVGSILRGSPFVGAIVAGAFIYALSLLPLWFGAPGYADSLASFKLDPVGYPGIEAVDVLRIEPLVLVFRYLFWTFLLGGVISNIACLKFRRSSVG